MSSEAKEQGNLVFGLDIGTRSIVGTVGYREGDNFIILGQEVREHETRSMLDGQIHDIGQVGNTIAQVKKELEKSLNVKLTDVCIAAAGRVLRTVETSVTQEFEKDQIITEEDIVSLNSLAIENAYEKFMENNDTDIKFYCVGSSVIRYYMNGYQIGNLESHKAKSIGEDVIATFLPDDVVDGLYKAVEIAGLRVVNMTLEPIAAIAVAIPEMYRLLNIALVDVGAGTSDICITKDGCITAYGMIPIAGDSLTEVIAKECLVDFGTAENIKRGIKDADEVEYKDIMGLPQKISKETVLNLLNANVDDMTKQVADKIKELNGDKSVSAVFVVGGGGKIDTYTQKLAGFLDIVPERVALRGEDVMQKIIFKNENALKDSLYITPIGICLNFYEQSNNFIYVTFNEERIKLYDNGKLAIVDAAMHAQFPNDGLFPKRGKAINYTVNGIKKIQRGGLGEPAKIYLNKSECDIYEAIRANDVIEVVESTAGEAATLPLAKVPEFKAAISANVNGSKVLLPKFALVNGQIKTQYYDVCDGDDIRILEYYTVAQVKEFMDVTLDDSMTVLVNNEQADDETKVYDNFSIKWVLKTEVPVKQANESIQEKVADASEAESFADLPEEEGEVEYKRAPVAKDEASGDNLDETSDENTEEVSNEVQDEAKEPEKPKVPVSIGVIVNARPVVLKGKPSYVFVDVFDFIDFDTKTVQGKALITKIDNRPAEYMEPIHEGAVIDIYWEN